MQNQGWIKLHRKILENPIFSSEKGFKVWIWCLLKANHDDKEIYIGLKKVLIKNGQFIFGRDVASKELKMKPSTLRNWMWQLKQDSYIDIKTTSKYSVISILKWNEYQSGGQVKGQQNDNKVKTKGQQNDTNKNDKNDKERRITNVLALTKYQMNTLKQNFPYIDLGLETRKANDYLRASGLVKTDYLAWFRNWLRRIKPENTKNPILEDLLFKQWCEGKLKDPTVLDKRYPLYKFEKEWQEARKVKAEQIFTKPATP